MTEGAGPARGRRYGAGRAGRYAVAVTSLAAAVLTASGAAAHASDLNVTLIDNSRADSWLEIDRSGNLEIGDGTAGSDHDGSAVDLMDTLMNPDRPGDGSHGDAHDD